jgi:hypothetical protein
VEALDGEALELLELGRPDLVLAADTAAAAGDSRETHSPASAKDKR